MTVERFAQVHLFKKRLTNFSNDARMSRSASS